MENLVIPPNPNWFLQSICHATPDNGLIYGAMTKIVYIPPKKNSSDKIKVFDLNNRLCALAIHPDWVSFKKFAIINGDLDVVIYDFETGEAKLGHKGHETENNRQMYNQQPHTSIAYLKQNAVLSSVNSNVIHYCLLKNTFKIYLDLAMRNPITILKQAPKDNNMVAAGTKNGLILLIAVDKMEVISKLRGHDTEISSLDWMYFSMKPKEILKEQDKNSSLQNLIASTDTSDVFDVYEENNDNEFGVYETTIIDRSDDEETNDAEMQEKIVSNSNFNFLEECKNLKSDMQSDEKTEESSSKRGTYDDNKEQYGVKNEENPSIDESLQSNASSRTPDLTEESLNYVEECQRMKDFVIVSKEEIEQIDEIPVLASGSREQIAWLWDINDHRDFCKIKWHPKAKPVLPTPFTNVLWIDQSTLLITDGNGDLNEYKINLNVATRTISCKEQKDKTFDAKGILNICKSENSFVIWTSSIHRHISCFDVQKNYEKVISLDTIQLRIHFIVENPIDSNVIAIGGNDKRICLWNTSEASHEKIALRPFMNKIHSGVLCLSWHPEKDNILAFSTREGRIGVLDVNKSANVPIILTAFSTKEIYSIAWAKIQDSVVLIACNGQKLVYYSQKDQWKMVSVDHLRLGASVAVNGNLLAVGSLAGDLFLADISRNFYILMKKKISRKYIGMITWHGNKLAIATEHGITFIKHIDLNISELLDEDLLQLKGHQGRVFAVRFNKAGNNLVSCCFGGYVKVWDVETLTVVSSFHIDTLVYSAIFLPSNENIIVCGGQESTVVTYNWREQTDGSEIIVESKKKKKKPSVNHLVDWATPIEVVAISKNSQRRQTTKISKSNGEDSITELSSEIFQMSLQSKKSPTLFNLSSRELTSNPLEFIEKITNEEERDPSFNEMIFGKREEVKGMIEKELEHAKQLKTSGGVILPQLGDTLKDDILSRITSKTLTELHVAIAPSISFDLWKKCCVAYANQLVENEDSLTAIPYFLAVNDIDDCIQKLCDGKHFREAWIVSKMRKIESDPVFEIIFKKWMAYFVLNGNFEAATALLVCKRDFKAAAEMLDKRSQKNEKVDKVLKIIRSKTE